MRQKTAYEISACLVGSEMCIRASAGGTPVSPTVGPTPGQGIPGPDVSRGTAVGRATGTVAAWAPYRAVVVRTAHAWVFTRSQH